jgi:hypothetical protein
VLKTRRQQGARPRPARDCRRWPWPAQKSPQKGSHRRRSPNTATAPIRRVGWELSSELLTWPCRLIPVDGAPLRNRTVGLLLTISTVPCTECTSGTDSTDNRTCAAGPSRPVWSVPSASLMHNSVSLAYSSLEEVTGAAGKAAGRQARHLHGRRPVRSLVPRLYPPGPRRAILFTGHHGPAGRSITPGSGGSGPTLTHHAEPPLVLSAAATWPLPTATPRYSRREHAGDGAGGPVGAAEERVAHRCALREAQRVGEDGRWCLGGRVRARRPRLAQAGMPAGPL